jgi:phage anti-repressor protein
MILKNILSFLFNPKNGRLLTMIVLVVLALLLFRQCEQTRKAEWETTRISNNLKASQDTIRNYVDKNGNSAAEIRALTLTLDEAKEMVEFEKNRPPVTVIKYETKIVEKLVESPVASIDTVIGNFNSAAVIASEASWGKSSRKIKTTVPYSFTDGKATFGDATIDLEQNIFLTASILRDKKTKEVFVNLSTDYPGTKFNSAQGIMIDQTSSGFRDLQRQSRKSLGLGLQLGMGFTGNGISPYVGIGLNYTPKFLQW